MFNQIRPYAMCDNVADVKGPIVKGVKENLSEAKKMRLPKMILFK